MVNGWGKSGIVADFIFLGSKITADCDCSHEIKRCWLLESYNKPRQSIKKQRHYFANKGPYSQSYVFSNSYVQMWELDHKEDWVSKKWCFQIVVLEKTLETPLDSKEIKPVNPKGNQPWIFIRRTDAKAEAPIFWPPDTKSWLIGKDHNAGKDWGQEEKKVTEDKMFGWHRWLNVHEFEQTPADGEGQGSLACCRPWGRKSWTWLSNWTTTTKGICCLPLWRLNAVLLQLLTFNMPWRESRVENEALCAPGKLVEMARYFQEWISWCQSLYIFIPGKVLNSFMVTSAPHD